MALFQQLLSAEFIGQLQRQSQQRTHSRVYSGLVVLWLLVVQRLRGGAPLEAAVVELLSGLPASFWPRPCKRIRDWQAGGKLPSHNTGAYNQARQALPVDVVRQSCDRIFQSLVTQMASRTGPQDRQFFLLDGTSMRAPHTPSLCQAYPPGSNQYGEQHWPLLRVLLAHDLHTGLAARPEWGPMYGPAAISEQQLLERILDRLPLHSCLLADANFGVFSVVWAATQRNHPVLLRLTPDRARRLVGGPLCNGIDRPLTWRPSRADRERHPHFQVTDEVQGRLIVRLVHPDNGAQPFLIAFFTTLQMTSDQMLQTYSQRWNIETDIRTLKSVLNFEQLSSLTPEMMEKEIEMGVAAYNLVRAVILQASQQTGLPPRAYRFASVRRIVEAFSLKIATAQNREAQRLAFSQMLSVVQQATRPKRKTKRPSYPRRAWPRPKTYSRPTK